MCRTSAAFRSRRGAVSLGLSLILCVALAACGDLPRPFQPAHKSTYVWSGPGDVAWGSILVPPVEGLPAPQSEALVQQVADALRTRDVPASARAGGRGSLVLAGHVAVVTGKLRWSLITPAGETALRFEEPRLDAPSSGTSAADLAAIAARVAGQVAAFLKPPATEDPGHPSQLPVVIEAVRGAPGDGGIALARAMWHSLARVGVTVADGSNEESLSVQGWVSVARDDSATESATVTIAWDVLHPDGTRLGTITQRNRVGADQLTGTWGVLPRLVARAGAPGIAQLLARPDLRQATQLPRRKASEKSPVLSATESPLALLIEASARPTAALAEAPPTPIARPQTKLRFKPLPEAPAIPAVAVVEAPIAVSVTVQ